jgi:hypothetical protein
MTLLYINTPVNLGYFAPLQLPDLLLKDVTFWDRVQKVHDQVVAGRVDYRKSWKRAWRLALKQLGWSRDTDLLRLQNDVPRWAGGK